MAELVRSFIERLRSGIDPDLKRNLWMISDLLRKAWSEDFRSGIEQIDAEEITPDEALELRDALLQAFHNAPNQSDSLALLHTLAASDEKSVRDDLVKELHLAFEMHRSASARLYRVLNSLDDVGEDPFERSETSRSIDYVEMNIRAAERFLRSRGILVPL